MRLLVLKGDGIGPEIVSAALMVTEALNRHFNLTLEFEEGDFGLAAIDKNGDPLPEATLEKVHASDGIICGPHDSLSYPPPHDQAITPASRLRRCLDLFANIRPARIAETAFQLARQRRGKVTVMHKGNVLNLTDGLLREMAFDIATRYPDVTVDEVLADAIFALVVRRPQAFDVILTTNLYGDFLSDLTAEMVGGLGVGGAINAGHDICAAQAAHGSAPDIMGQNVANPTAMILSVGMLLDWLGARHERADLKDAARRLEAALDQQLAEAAGRTRDLGEALATDAFADALAERIATA